jgi:hypothetical protein
MKDLQEQLQYAHAQFDNENYWFNFINASRICAPKLLEDRMRMMELWLAIIDSLTILVDQESENAQFEVVLARKELRHAKCDQMIDRLKD